MDEQCPHDSLSGDEGPVRELGRMPVRWRCDECDAIVYDDPIEAIQAAVVTTINTVGATLVPEFMLITSSPIPDDEVKQMLELP